MRNLNCAAALMGVGIILGLPPSSWAGPFTGPTSPYYLDNYNIQEIYVVQGTSVIESFPSAYGANGTSSCPSNFCEANLAVTNVVSTNWFGSHYGSPGTAGQYTLSGTPTGTSWTTTPPPAGESENIIYDGTSDGTHNYTVEFQNSNDTENVIATNLNWQNPTVLFSLGTGPGLWLGIAYDPANNSLWVSGYNADTIADYTLTGTLLSSFTTGLCCMVALGFDPADGTLWFSNNEGNTLDQYSTSGTLLQDGIPTGLPAAYYGAGDFAEASSVPEPSSLALLGVGLVALGAVGRRKRKASITWRSNLRDARFILGGDL